VKKDMDHYPIWGVFKKRKGERKKVTIPISRSCPEKERSQGRRGKSRKEEDKEMSS